MRILFTFLMAITAFDFLFSCSCLPQTIPYKYHRSEFVGVVEFVEIEIDKEDEDYHLAKVKTINIFKGKLIESIRIHSSLSSSCSFLPDKNVEWLVFPVESKDGPVIGYCSGSRRIKPYPNNSLLNYEEYYNEHMYFTKWTLDIVKNISLLNSNGVCTSFLDDPFTYEDVDSINLPESIIINEYDFGIYKLSYDDDLKLCSINIEVSPKNKVLNEYVGYYFKWNTKVRIIKRVKPFKKQILAVIRFERNKQGEVKPYFYNYE